MFGNVCKQCCIKMQLKQEYRNFIDKIYFTGQSSTDNSSFNYTRNTKPPVNLTDIVSVNALNGLIAIFIKNKDILRIDATACFDELSIYLIRLISLAYYLMFNKRRLLYVNFSVSILNVDRHVPLKAE